MFHSYVRNYIKLPEGILYIYSKKKHSHRIHVCYILYMATFTINIPPMLAYIPYMDPMGLYIYTYYWLVVHLPLWKIWVRQLGWWNSHMESHKIPWFQTTNQIYCYSNYYITIINHRLTIEYHRLTRKIHVPVTTKQKKNITTWKHYQSDGQIPIFRRHGTFTPWPQLSGSHACPQRHRRPFEWANPYEHGFMTIPRFVVMFHPTISNFWAWHIDFCAQFDISLHHFSTFWTNV